MHRFLRKVSALLVLALCICLVSGCTDDEANDQNEKNSPEIDVNDTGDSDFTDTDTEDPVDTGPPSTWPEGYVPHTQSEDCLDRYTDYHPGPGWRQPLEFSPDIFGPPRCKREEDGFGGYCDKEEGVVDPYYYFYCDDPEWTDAETGETIVRVEPCVWWLKSEEVDDECEFTMVCVPEDRLVEMNWPDDAEFNYHFELGVNFSGCSWN